MKKIFTIALAVLFISCEQNTEELNQLRAEKEYVENNVQMYTSVWERVFSERNIDLVTSENFDENVTVVTAQGDITGIDGLKAFYGNYINGFSDAEFIIIDAFGQGDKIVKHWRFKGTHDGEFFGVPATGKQVDISGVTLVKMKDGKIASEQDFMDFLAFYTQLGLM